MATKKKQATANTPPSSPPSRKNFTPRTPIKSPIHPRKKHNNGFSRDVDNALLSNSAKKGRNRKLEHRPPPAAAEEEATLPKHDQKESARAMLDAYGPAIPPPAQHVEEEFDQLSLEHKAAEALYGRPKYGEIYEAVTVDVERIQKHLKDLSVGIVDGTQKTPETIILRGREIADSVSLLMMKGSSSDHIEMAGKKAQMAVNLMLQAEMKVNKARELFAESIDMLHTADLK